jgi:hypothetical protein
MAKQASFNGAMGIVNVPLSDRKGLTLFSAGHSLT